MTVRHHASLGNDMILKGYYYQTIHIYQHSSGSLYIEEMKHHDGRSLTNIIDTNHVSMMIESFKPKNVYTGFSHNHPLRNDETVGGYWQYDGEFTHIGMDDSDLLMYLTRDVLS